MTPTTGGRRGRFAMQDPEASGTRFVRQDRVGDRDPLEYAVRELRSRGDARLRDAGPGTLGGPLARARARTNRSRTRHIP